jgi:hypothetical protein
MVVVLRCHLFLQRRRRDLLSLDNGLVQLEGWSSDAMMSRGRKLAFTLCFAKFRARTYPFIGETWS